MAMSPQVQEAIAKNAIEVFKAQSDAMEKAARAGYYQSAVALNEFHRSKEYLDHEIAKAEAPQRVHGEELRKLAEFNREMEKRDAEELRGVPTPPLIKRHFGVSDMGELARYYGKNNMEKLMVAALQAEAHMYNARVVAGQNEALKWLGIAERYNNDIIKIQEKTIPQAEWDKMTQADRQRAMLLGQTPRTPEVDAALKQLQAEKDAALRKAYGPAWDQMKAIQNSKSRDVRVIEPRTGTAPAPAPKPAPTPGAPQSSIEFWKNLFTGGGSSKTPPAPSSVPSKFGEGVGQGGLEDSMLEYFKRLYGEA